MRLGELFLVAVVITVAVGCNMPRAVPLPAANISQDSLVVRGSGMCRPKDPENSSGASVSAMYGLADWFGINLYCAYEDSLMEEVWDYNSDTDEDRWDNENLIDRNFSIDMVFRLRDGKKTDKDGKTERSGTSLVFYVGPGASNYKHRVNIDAPDEKLIEDTTDTIRFGLQGETVLTERVMLEFFCDTYIHERLSTFTVGTGLLFGLTAKSDGPAIAVDLLLGGASGLAWNISTGFVWHWGAEQGDKKIKK